MADKQIVVVNKKVEAQYVEMMVPLYSYGCEKKVKKALSHLKGIYSVNVDYCQQKVTVWGICNKFDVLSTIKSKRKEARFWNLDDNMDREEAVEEESKNSKASTFIKPSLSLIRSNSFSWRAVKKVFSRSHSF
ncbi:PREDICTED: protein SODIUM POTASSIUM ROOT DEFECTIVE 2 [Tarenaya hassleriana]|uniref:protein SODIUM POTASSIUM ROOT DEFECTIVE 2 n=1 Tax=Tarenaya hassleriana TaxID=28532 RepID=UPI00053C9F5E|nr:PREDICTED: protein SODIUM POTASSIUM ROOT DEFECTIVE 2 [Tarenaya hassleriana]